MSYRTYVRYLKVITQFKRTSIATNQKKQPNMGKITYNEAMMRLEEITAKIQGGKVDIDELAGLLKEAQELVNFCREKLYKVDEEIKALTEGEG